MYAQVSDKYAVFRRVLEAIKLQVRDPLALASITEAILESPAASMVAAARQLTSCHTAHPRVRMVMKISSKFAEVKHLHGPGPQNATVFSIGLAQYWT
jgi:hypothetical protein